MTLEKAVETLNKYKHLGIEDWQVSWCLGEVVAFSKSTNTVREEQEAIDIATGYYKRTKPSGTKIVDTLFRCLATRDSISMSTSKTPESALSGYRKAFTRDKEELALLFESIIKD